jgi:DNA polymerase III delta prime subunit
VVCTVLIAIIIRLAVNDKVQKWLEAQPWYSLKLVGLVLIVLLVVSIAVAVRKDRPDAHPSAASEAEHKRNRQRMLQRVRHDWIEGVLEKSLYQVARMDLGLDERPDAIENSLRLVVQESGQPARPLPPRTKLVEVFDKHAGALLLLGAPGSGKTTLLLELARDLLDRAEKDGIHAIPVVFNLSSWAVKRPPLAEWLAEELNRNYDVPRKTAQDWVERDELLLLLDGLDEVAEEHRGACVMVINGFRTERGLVRLAVASRVADYETLDQQLHLSGAGVIQPITRALVEEYFKFAKGSLGALQEALDHDPLLWELLDNPLMVSIAMLAYRGADGKALPATGTLADRHTRLFAMYVDAMFQRRSRELRYTRDQTARWLAWRASSMVRLRLSSFQLEGLGRDWLATRSQRVRLGLGVGVVSGLGVGLGVGLVGWLGGGLGFGLVFGLVAGLIDGLFLGLFGGLITRAPTDTLLWRWPTRGRLADNAVFSLGGGLVGGLAVALGAGLRVGLGAGLCVALGVCLLGYLGDALVSREITVRGTPNMGTRRSARNSMVAALVFGLVLGVICGLVGRLASRLAVKLVRGLGVGLFVGLISGALYGLTGGLLKGGGFCIRHWITRLLLWRCGYTPRRYVDFLDYAAERIFLRKFGGGYIFVHRMLMEYFASLWQESGSITR